MTKQPCRGRTFPKRAGLYWATLDDGEEVLEVAPLRVHFYDGCSSFDDGVLVEFVDGSGRAFGMENIEQEIVQPGRDVTLASRGWTRDGSVRITWLGEIKPPRKAPKPGDDCRIPEPATYD